MSVAVAARLGARLARYADALRLARKGEASLARLLGLARERLPALEPDEPTSASGRALAADASLDVWPVAVAPELDHALIRAVAALTPRPDDPLPASGDALRRAVRLAQDDGALDVRALARWSEAEGPALTRALGLTYARTLREVGAGEGGEELALLLHHATLAAAARRVGDLPAGAALLDGLWSGVVAEAAEALGAADTLSARFALRLQLATSPLALVTHPAPDVDLRAWAERACSPYRTRPELVARAAQLLEPPLEVVDLARVEAALVERALVDPAWSEALTRDAFEDRAREFLLVVVGSARDAPDGWRALTHEPRLLRQALFNHRRRALLEDELARFGGAHKAAEAARALVAAAESLDVRALGGDAPVRRRAELAARGAMSLVLDAHVVALHAGVRRALVLTDDDARAHAEGRRLRLAPSGPPPRVRPERPTAPVLYVGLHAAEAVVLRRGPRLAAPSLEREVHAPTIAELERAGLEVTREPEGLVARGEITRLFEVAAPLHRRVAARLARWARGLDTAEAARVAELDAERARLDVQLDRLDVLHVSGPGDPASRALLDEGRALLLAERGRLDDARRRLAPGDDTPPLALAIVDDDGATLTGRAALALARRLVTQSPAAARARRDRRLRVEREVGGAVRHAFAAERVDGEPWPHVEGVVVTDGALEAWCRALRGLVRTEARETVRGELAPGLQRRFEWPGVTERWVAATREDDEGLVVLLHEVGTLGVARDVVVYELLAPDDPFVVAMGGA